jgi:hypothetical protein
MLEYLNEVVKTFIKQPDVNFRNDTSTIAPDFVMKDLTDPSQSRSQSFFDNDYNSIQKTGLYSQANVADVVMEQAAKIDVYRRVAKNTEVSNAIDEIVNEVTFSYNEQDPIILNLELENEALKDAITKSWEKIVRLTNLKYTIDDIVRRGYIDGQIFFHCTYSSKGTRSGIKKIRMMDPRYLYFDRGENVYKYYENILQTKTIYALPEFTEKMQYSPEEIVRVDFGLYDDFLVLSYLEDALKNANMLQNLEDMLIPLRFSRSVSRRVFNVDVGDLPPSRAEEVMRDIQKKFKYNKFYNTNTGEITNQSHITSMVEDYWFANRAGGKGTEVNVLDETGNLGELADILYFCKKLYRSMKVPTSRIDINPDGDASYNWKDDNMSIEDMRFFTFCFRLRHVYIKIFEELLKRELIATGVLSQKEYDRLEGGIVLKFANENTFFEKMKLDNFTTKMEIWGNIKDDAGKILPVTKIFKDIFKMSDDEIEETLEQIRKESKDPRFKNFYEGEDYSDGDYEASSEEPEKPEDLGPDAEAPEPEITQDDLEGAFTAGYDAGVDDTVQSAEE